MSANGPRPELEARVPAPALIPVQDADEPLQTLRLACLALQSQANLERVMNKPQQLHPMQMRKVATRRKHEAQTESHVLDVLGALPVLARRAPPIGETLMLVACCALCAVAMRPLSAESFGKPI